MNSIAELFNGEEKIAVKPSMLFELMKQAAKSEFMLRALKCDTPTAYVIATFGERKDLEYMYNAEEYFSKVLYSGSEIPGDSSEDEDKEDE